jgi:hypothetical protein
MIARILALALALCLAGCAGQDAYTTAKGCFLPPPLFLACGNPF